MNSFGLQLLLIFQLSCFCSVQQGFDTKNYHRKQNFLKSTIIIWKTMRFQHWVAKF